MTGRAHITSPEHREIGIDDEAIREAPSDPGRFGMIRRALVSDRTAHDLPETWIHQGKSIEKLRGYNKRSKRALNTEIRVRIMSREISRREIIGGTLAATTLGASAGGLRAALAEQSGPIKIGILQTLSGALAEIGRQHLLGAQIAVNELNESGGVGGRQLELVVRDDQFKTDVGVAAAYELAGMGVNMLLGEAISTILFATEPLFPQLKMVSISPSVSVIDATHGKFNRNFFRCAGNAHMQYFGQSIVMPKQAAPSAKRWGALVSDYVGARQVWDFISAGLKKYYPQYAKHDIELAEPVLVKVGTTDFHQAIARLLSQNLDALHVAATGSDGITFYKQAEQYGLFQKLKVISDTSLAVQVGPALKSKTPPHLWGACLWYYDGYKQLPMAQRFYKNAIAKSNSSIIDPFCAQAHTGIMSFAAAIRSAKSTDTEAIISALETVTFDSVFGPLKYRQEDHQLLVDQGYLHLEPQPADPGYRVAGFVTISWQDVTEPAAPGVDYKL